MSEEEARETPHCATCRRSALEGRAHSFTRAHARHVHAEMKRLRAKVELAVRELPTPRVFTVQPGAAAEGDEGDRAFWCPMCRISARKHARDGRLVVALAGTVQHLASPDHERSIHRYWRENHLDQGLKKNYLITPMQCNKFLTAAGLALSAFEEEEERLLKEEAELIRQQEKKRQELMSSLSKDWPGVTPLSSVDPSAQSELHASDSSGPITHVHKVLEKPRGNIHTGATPPWLMDDDGGGTNCGDRGGDDDTKEQRDVKAPVIGPSYEAFLHHRAQSRQTPLPPGRVGATFDRLAAASDPAWLPQFSNAWNTGRRGPQRLRHQKKRDWRGTETLPAASDAANGTETLPGVSDAEIAAERKRDWRNFAGFWILGLTNNFAYVVMLSAAHDILKQQEARNSTHTNSSSSSFMHDTSPATHTESWELISSNRFDCNPNSTAVILLADILPTLLIKSTAPLFIHRIAYRFRVVICVLTAAASFLIVALSNGVIMSIIGVTFASISSGLGELTFLSLTAHFKSSVLRFWSSGTGAAGLAGSLSYLGFTQAGLSPSATLFVMLFVPPLMAASYWLLLVFPPGWSQRECGNSCSLRPPAAEESQRPLLGADSDDLTPDPNNEHYGLENDSLSLKDKWLIVKCLLRFTIPLALVYFAEYFINQGLFELLYFPNYYLSHGDQYRWYQATYQLGVFISRSSAQWIRISRTWILALLQVINLIVFFFLVFFTVLPTFWLALPIILWEGLLGGAAYVNTFLNISAERDKRRREFSLGVASVADTLGIALSGATAIPLHDYLCAL